MKKLIFLTLITTLFFSCKPDDQPMPEGDVSFHLLTSFETFDNFKIHESSILWDSNVYLSYDDLESYDRDSYSFKLSEEAIEFLDNQEFNVHGTGFVVVAGEDPVYTGYFWPSYSSMSCDWLVADPLMAGITGELRMRLGYPGGGLDGLIPDKRNKDIILDIFRRDGKLIE